MIYMTLFWIIALICVALYFLQKYIFPRFPLESIFSVLFFLGASFLIVGVLTRDPLFAQFGVPAEYEWVIGLSITAFSSWQVYFNPLKKKVYAMDREIGELKTDMQTVKVDIALIKEKVLSL